MHTLFNIVTTLILLPFGGALASFAEKILPAGKEAREEEEEMTLKYLKPIQSGKVRLGATAIHLGQLKQEISRMMDMARKNVETGFDAILTGDLELMEQEKKREEYIDFLNKEISQYISKTFTREKNARNFEAVEEYFLITGNVERIGDHADNICGYVKVAKDHKVQFSEEAVAEIQKMKDLSLKALDSLSTGENGTPEWLSEIAAMEQKMDDMTERYRRRHLERMKEGLCSEEACILYSEMLTDFERIGDHILNIAQADVKIPREN
jgi:phosphate:Na+ symporter